MLNDISRRITNLPVRCTQTGVFAKGILMRSSASNARYRRSSFILFSIPQVNHQGQSFHTMTRLSVTLMMGHKTEPRLIYLSACEHAQAGRRIKGVVFTASTFQRTRLEIIAFSHLTSIKKLRFCLKLRKMG